MAGKGLSVMPLDAQDIEDENRLAQALGRKSVPTTKRGGQMPPEPEQRVVLKPAAKETVSVRINPHLKQCLAVVGEGINWSANQIMTMIVEREARRLIDVFNSGGSGAAIEHLMSRSDQED